MRWGFWSVVTSSEIMSKNPFKVWFQWGPGSIFLVVYVTKWNKSWAHRMLCTFPLLVWSEFLSTGFWNLLGEWLGEQHRLLFGGSRRHSLFYTWMQRWETPSGGGAHHRHGHTGLWDSGRRQATVTALLGSSAHSPSSWSREAGLRGPFSTKDILCSTPSLTASSGRPAYTWALRRFSRGFGTAVLSRKGIMLIRQGDDIFLSEIWKRKDQNPELSN